MSPPTKEWVNLQLQMHSAMDKVLSSSKHPTVGGFVMRMQDIDRAFRYFGSAVLDLRGVSTRPSQLLR